VFAFLLRKLSAFEQFGLLLLRAGSGIFLAFLHGWRKLDGLYNHLVHDESWRFIQTVELLGFPIPFIFASLAAIIEFIGGLFLAVGFYTRYAAVLIGIVMTVAMYRHLISDMRYELASLFLLITIYFAVRGPGRFSIDRVLKKDH
jgi:putative oxidoreductase